MFLVWKGWGFLTPVIMLAIVVPSVIGAGELASAMGWVRDQELLGLALGLFTAAAANWFLGRYFNNRPGRELLDPKTGETVVLRHRHDLFFVKMEYWSVLFALAGVVFLYSYGSRMMAL